MDLSSKSDFRLLRNFVSVEILKNKSDNVTDSNDIYNNMLTLLHNGDTNQVIDILNAPTNIEDFSKFSQDVLSRPANELCSEYVDMAKQIMVRNNIFSKDKFKEFLKAFFKENEILNPYNTKIAAQQQQRITQNHLKTLNALIKGNTPRTINSEQFKDFSAQFSDTVKAFGISKFQQHFVEQEQTILDMNISSGMNKNSTPTYVTDFTLSDNISQETTHQVLEETASQSGFTSTYYQNLCYSYLEAKKYSQTEDTSKDLIFSKMNTFKECYKKLEAMAKCKIAIANNRLFCYAVTHTEPEREYNNDKTQSSTEEPVV